MLPLSSVEDCYNLRLEAPPLMLTRSAHDNKFQILWPERRDFAIEDHEFFEFLEENRLYTTVWYEDPNYREEVLVRDYETGEVLERRGGFWCEEVLHSVWVNPLLQALIDAAQSEQTSRTIRIVCTILVSLLYLIGLACLFLLVFVIEGQGLFIRGFFLVMGIIVLADYLKFLKALVRKRRKKASKGYPVK